MSKVNKLTSSILLQEQSKLFVQKKVIVNINKKDYEVLVDQKFRNSKIQEMIAESLKNLAIYNDLNDSVRTSYIMFLFIKYFTNLDVAKVDNFEDQIRVLNAMIDLDIYSILVNSFPESELEKINEYMLKFNSKIDNFIKDDKNIEDLKKIFGDGLVDVDGEELGKVDESENGESTDETNELVNKIEITDTE